MIVLVLKIKERKILKFSIYKKNRTFLLNLLNSTLFSVDDTKLHSPTFPFARPTASSKSPELRNDGATQRIY